MVRKISTSSFWRLKTQFKTQLKTHKVIIKNVLVKLFEILLISAALLSPLIARGATIEAEYVGITFKLSGTTLLGALDKDWPKQTSSIYLAPEVSISEDLHERVRQRQLSASDALQIETELMSKQGTTYYLPQTQAELKISVGFPKDTYLSREDLRDLVPVHVQVSIGVSPMTASYIVEKLVVKTTSDAGDSTAVGSTAPANESSADH